MKKKENFLKIFRSKRILTQEELSKKIGYSLSTIKKYESSNNLSTKFVKQLKNSFILDSFEKDFLNKSYKEIKYISLKDKEKELEKKALKLKVLENKIKKDKISLEKEKILINLENNKSDYLKIKDTLVEIKSIIGKLDRITLFSKGLKSSTKKEIDIILKNDIEELKKIRKRFMYISDWNFEEVIDNE